MAEAKNQDASALTIKRKLDAACEEDKEENYHPNKTPKLQSFPANADKNGNSPLKDIVEQTLESSFNKVVEAEEEEEVEEEEDSEEAEVVDTKGKGIMVEEEEEEDDDDDSDNDDSSDDEIDFDGDDSELEDDPLAEVDLDNILPSRTRRRVVHPDFNIAHDDGEEDDSDDSDA